MLDEHYIMLVLIEEKIEITVNYYDYTSRYYSEYNK